MVADTADAADEARFDRLYRTYANDIRAYCLRRLRPDDAADAAADVFVVVWRRLADCPLGDEAKLWMYGIARNVVANHRRAAARSASLLSRVAGTASTDDSGPEPVVVRRSEYEQLDRALAKLPDRYREVLVLAEWDGLDREAIARLEGVSRNAIDQRISRGYRKLARLMNRRQPRTEKEHVFMVPRRNEGGR